MKTGGMQKGFKYSKKRIWINNGKIETLIFEDESIPDTFTKGRLKFNKPAWNKGKKMREETCLKLKQINSNNKWYNNGKIEKCIKGGKELPKGFKEGRLPMSEETKKKLSQLNKGENNGNYNHRWTEEQKLKASERQKLNPTKWTEEQKLAQSIRLKGINTWSKGRVRTPKTIQKFKDSYSKRTENDIKLQKEKEWLTRKFYGTDKKHKTKDEIYVESILRKYFDGDDIEYQYFDKQRYPFMCDFYIKSKDLFIEVNSYPSHNNHAYDENNLNDKEIVNMWKYKYEVEGKRQYKNWIYTWTDLDVRKINIAKSNNLNYISLYDINQLEVYLNDYISKD